MKKQISLGCLFSLLLTSSLYADIVDPTRPPGLTNIARTSMAMQPLIVTAIYIHGEKRLAIINGELMQIGDKLGEFTITTITTNTVELVGSANTKIVLQLATTVKNVTHGKDKQGNAR